MKTFRIFLASPGDVEEERALAREVIDEIRHEPQFADRVNIQVVAWDQQGMGIPMPMGVTPQAAIAHGLRQPQDCDLLLLILWARMGTPLPLQDYQKADGTAYLSGTEWEFHNGLASFMAKGTPNIWLYRRQEKTLIDIAADDLYARRKQWEHLQSFYQQMWYQNGAVKHGYNDYDKPAQFRRQFERHLRNHLARYLRASRVHQYKQLAQHKTSFSRSAIAKPASRSVGKQKSRLIDKPFPSVARIGEDRYGRWLTIHHRGAEQRFRWIPPGSFMMGSPNDELERTTDEVLHQVTLSHGFWLGDTAVSQAFWRAVMGNNPSSFKADRLPVERISWIESQEMIQSLKQLYPDLPLRLPYEAEWEYACRAGTNTPFYWGYQISTEQANYDGNFPYSNGPKGEYREQTLPVDSFEPNAWGLYQMHGNVWEWCDDHFAELPKSPQLNPSGPKTGLLRVIRGGAWYVGGWRLRSASRVHWLPTSRDAYLGLRLALGPEL